MSWHARSLALALVVAASLGCGARPAGPGAVPPAAAATTAPVSEPPAPREPPELRTALLLDSAAEGTMGHITMEILSPSGDKTFSCATEVGERAPEMSSTQWPCAHAKDWVRGPGKYTLRIHMHPYWKSNIDDIVREFRVDGDELGFAALLWIGSMPHPPQNPFVLKFMFDRIRAAPRSMTLQRLWDPAAHGSPAYEIRNGSQQTVHGITMWGNFFGHVEMLKEGRWTTYERGGLCGTVTGGEPLPPGGHATSTEGYFIGETEPFAPGRYRYVVQVALAQSWGGVPSEAAEKGVTTFEDREIFELRDEITIQ